MNLQVGMGAYALVLRFGLSVGIESAEPIRKGQEPDEHEAPVHDVGDIPAFEESEEVVGDEKHIFKQIPDTVKERRPHRCYF